MTVSLLPTGSPPPWSRSRKMIRNLLNLIEMAANYCTSFDLEAELKKGTTTSDVSLVPKTQKRISTRRNVNTINTSKMRTDFVAPLRGRGFISGATNTGRVDLFRSCPPNTSCPPFMHVDDFVKMETHRPPIGMPTYYMHGNSSDKKDGPDQRFVASPSENFAFYIEREIHQRTFR